MSRLLMLIAMLFAFAAVGGASASYAHGGQASHRVFGAVAAVAGQCVATDAAQQIDIYKPCTKKLGGIAIPCPHQPSVLPQAVAEAMPETSVGVLPPVVAEFRDGRVAEGQFRPPRA